MKIAAKIFISQCLLALLGTGYLAYLVLDELSPRYRESLEEPLVDCARVLAAVLAEPLAGNDPRSLDSFRQAVLNAQRDTFAARIYGLTKSSMDLSIYVTDAAGTVLYHSADPDEVGKSYAQWNDVLKTLRGEYGARTSRAVAHDPSTSTIYVAAPIMRDGRITGVVSVGKPAKNSNVFIARARARLQLAVGLLIAAVLALGYFVTRWISVPVEKLTSYARAVRDGKPATLPRLGGGEMQQLGTAFAEMREALEGKRYVEEYVQTLTHELKSPLAAIRGAAEIILEDPPAETRRQFAENILDEGGRIRVLVDKLLELSAIESRRVLTEVKEISLDEILRDLERSVAAQAARKRLTITWPEATAESIRGERFLLHQALLNLLQNAIDFSPAGGEVRISCRRGRDGVEISITDDGPGIPDFARERVFERFYSLQRPDTGKKSSGLGLSFVREAAELHGGSVSLLNRPTGGAVATIFIPDSHPLGR